MWSHIRRCSNPRNVRRLRLTSMLLSPTNGGGLISPEVQRSCKEFTEYRIKVYAVNFVCNGKYFVYISTV